MCRSKAVTRVDNPIPLTNFLRISAFIANSYSIGREDPSIKQAAVLEQEINEVFFRLDNVDIVYIAERLKKLERLGAYTVFGLGVSTNFKLPGA